MTLPAPLAKGGAREDRMTIISGHFDELEFWDSARFGKPVIKDTEIIVPADNI